VPSLLVDERGIQTYPKSTQELADIFDSIDTTYESANAADGSEGSPVFPESEEQLLKRCAKTTNEILKQQPTNNVCIVSHAPCDQSIAFYLEGADSINESNLGPWALGGVTKFRGNKLVIYSDTSHMPGMYQPGIKEWSLPCLDKK
jgi:broad specificity phosphatase PhoE